MIALRRKVEEDWRQIQQKTRFKIFLHNNNSSSTPIQTKQSSTDRRNISLCVIIDETEYQHHLLLQNKLQPTIPENARTRNTTTYQHSIFIPNLLLLLLEYPLPYEPDGQYAPSQSEHYTMQRTDVANPHNTFSSSIWHLANSLLKSTRVGR